MLSFDDEWLNLHELAEKWKVSVVSIEKQLVSGKLRPCIILPEMKLKKVMKYEADDNGPYPTEFEYEYTVGRHVLYKWISERKMEEK